MNRTDRNSGETHAEDSGKRLAHSLACESKPLQATSTQQLVEHQAELSSRVSEEKDWMWGQAVRSKINGSLLQLFSFTSFGLHELAY